MLCVWSVSIVTPLLSRFFFLIVDRPASPAPPGDRVFLLYRGVVLTWSDWDVPKTGKTIVSNLHSEGCMVQVSSLDGTLYAEIAVKSFLKVLQYFSPAWSFSIHRYKIVDLHGGTPSVTRPCDYFYLSCNPEYRVPFPSIMLSNGKKGLIRSFLRSFGLPCLAVILLNFSERFGQVSSIVVFYLTLLAPDGSLRPRLSV